MLEQQPDRQTVLCVDDLLENLSIRKLMLETFGYRVFTANCPNEALSVLEDEEVDLVLLDYSFPGQQSGEWLASNVRSRWPEVKLLMLSGYPNVPDSARESVDAYFTKGSDVAELRSMIESLLPSRSKPQSTPAQARNLELRKEAERLVSEAERWKRTG